MRAYFRHRRRSFLARARAVAAQFLFWLPILMFFLITRRSLAARRAASRPASTDLEFEARIEGLLSCYPSMNKRKHVREILERYAALHASLSDDELRGSGQFELFAISGNGNGSTGTPCLFRNNLSKLKEHKRRTVNDLIRLVTQGEGSTSNSASSQLGSFFEAFEDSDALKSLEGLKSAPALLDSKTVRLAA